MSISVSTPVEGAVSTEAVGSSSPNAAAVPLALSGRTVIVKDGGEVFHAAKSAPGSVSVTVGTPERVLGPDEFTPLPLPGEQVATVTDEGEHVTGRFLTADLEENSHLRMRCPRVALLIETPADNAIVRWVSNVEVNQWDARQCVRGDSSGVTVESLTTALVGQVRDRQSEDRKRAVWLSNLTSRAHDEGNDREWCGEFDDFLESVGLERRTREYDLRVEVTATLHFTRVATTLDAAIDAIDEEDVWDRLTSDDISFEVEGED